MTERRNAQPELGGLGLLIRYLPAVTEQLMAGLPQPKPHLTPEEQIEIAQKYQSGATPTQLAEEYAKSSPQTILDVIYKLGIEPHPIGRPKKNKT